MNPNDTVRRYLAELETALAGEDSALIHDALIDAEAHLDEAIASGTSAGEAIRDFGTPTEIARAYREAEKSRPVRPSPPKTPAAGGAAAPTKKPLSTLPLIGVWFDPYAWGSITLLTFGSGLSFATGIGALSLLLFCLGTSPLLIGIPCFVMLLGLARLLSTLTGRMIEFLVGVRMPHRTRPVDLRGAKGTFRRIGAWLADIRSWLSLLFVLGNMCVSLLLGTAFGLAIVAGLISAVAPAGIVNLDVSIDGTRHAIHLSHESVLLIPVGFLVLTLTLWAAKGVAHLYARVVKAVQVARIVST